MATDRPGQAARLTLRTRSLAARNALALAVSGGSLGDAELLDLAQADDLPASLFTAGGTRQLAALALTWAGMGRNRAELHAAALAYRAIWDGPGGDRLAAQHHRVAAQSLFLTDRPDDVRRLLPHLSRLPADARAFLTTDLVNPYRNRLHGAGFDSAAQHRHWEQLLSAPFTEHGLTPLALRSSTGATQQGHPFDRLISTGTTPGTVDGPLVSVVMPCYRPDEGLLTSITSICAQTYGSLQILLVDDASGPRSEKLFERALALDDRVTLIRMPTNGGAYLARNQALSRATGKFVTFQDSDDWSHPDRIGSQVALLRDATDRPACHTLAVRAHDDLSHQWLGYPTVRVHASSLLVRAGVVDRLGPFLPVRKGADSEYTERIAAEVGPVPTTSSPLAVYRLRAGSLSRSDFTLQWAAPDRLAFRGAYRAWLRAGRPAEVPVPLTFVRGLDHGRRVVGRLAIAYLGDFSADPEVDPGRAATVWAGPSGQHPDASRRDVAGDGQPWGVWHLEMPWTAGTQRSEMHGTWFDRIVADRRAQVLSRVEPVHVERLVVLDPSVLLFAGAQDCRVSADRVEVHVQPDDEDPGVAGFPIDLQTVEEVVRQWFGVAPEWVRGTSLAAAARG